MRATRSSARTVPSNASATFAATSLLEAPCPFSGRKSQDLDVDERERQLVPCSPATAPLSSACERPSALSSPVSGS